MQVIARFNGSSWWLIRNGWWVINLLWHCFTGDGRWLQPILNGRWHHRLRCWHWDSHQQIRKSVPIKGHHVEPFWSMNSRGAWKLHIFLGAPHCSRACHGLTTASFWINAALGFCTNYFCMLIGICVSPNLYGVAFDRLEIHVEDSFKRHERLTTSCNALDINTSEAKHCSVYFLSPAENGQIGATFWWLVGFTG